MVITRNLVTQHCPRDSVIRPVRAEELQHTSLCLNRDSSHGLWHADLAAVVLKHDFDKTLKYRISGMASPGTCVANYMNTLPRKPSAS
jgi:hypothetical protein